MIIKGGKIMIEVKTFKRYLREYGIPYAYDKTFLYVPGTTHCEDPCFWQFTVECGIITDLCMRYEMPDTPVKKCYDQRPWQSNRLKELTCDKINKLLHTSYNHTVEQMITIC